MEQTKLGFFKRVLISLKDFEKYILFALEDIKESFKYLFFIVLIFSVVLTAVYTIKIYKDGFGSMVGNEYNEILVKANTQINPDEMNELIKNEIGVFVPILFVSLLMVYFVTTIIDAGVLTLLGKILSMILGLNIKLKGIFGMAVHALTLPIILQTIYIPINILLGFEIKYFGWMYTTISYIYIVVAILMIKTEFINKERELTKIREEEQKLKITNEEKENTVDKKEEDKGEDKGEDTKDDNTKDGNSKDNEDKDNLAPEA